MAFSETPSAERLDAYVHQLYGETRPIGAAFFTAARRCDGRLRRLFAEHWLSGASGHHQRTVILQPEPPVAVLQGDQEPFFDPALIDGLTWGNLWRGAGQTIAGAGHAPFFEQPGRYADLVAAFLKEMNL